MENAREKPRREKEWKEERERKKVVVFYLPLVYLRCTAR